MKNQEYLKETYEWKDLLAIVHKLRQPDGCPWDSTQIYESMVTAPLPTTIACLASCVIVMP